MHNIEDSLVNSEGGSHLPHLGRSEIRTLG